MNVQEIKARLHGDLGGFYDLIADDIELSEDEYLELKKDLLNMDQKFRELIQKKPTSAATEAGK